MSLVLLTNVHQYAGPGAVAALLQDGHTVACHDASFVDATARAEFQARCPAHALEAQTPEAVYAEVVARWGIPDAVVSNDVHPIVPNDIEAIPLDHFRATFEAVVMVPIRLTQLFLPDMKALRRGAFVFVTSARETRPEPGFAVPTTLRAPTTPFPTALPTEHPPFHLPPNTY